MNHICKVCKSPLVNGIGHKLTASSKHFEVTIENVPVMTCPKGHEGLYWSDKKFGPAFMEKLGSEGIMAKARRTWTLRFRNVCVSCGEVLDKQRSVQTFHFEFDTETNKGRMMRVTLVCPALFCKRCNRHYMPYDKGELDMYYYELHSLLQHTIKSEFIV